MNLYLFDFAWLYGMMRLTLPRYGRARTQSRSPGCSPSVVLVTCGVGTTELRMERFPPGSETEAANFQKLKKLYLSMTTKLPVALVPGTSNPKLQAFWISPTSRAHSASQQVPEKEMVSKTEAF